VTYRYLWVRAVRVKRAHLGHTVTHNMTAIIESGWCLAVNARAAPSETVCVYAALVFHPPAVTACRMLQRAHLRITITMTATMTSLGFRLAVTMQDARRTAQEVCATQADLQQQLQSTREELAALTQRHVLMEAECEYDSEVASSCH
jgi:hypothetical protein